MNISAVDDEPIALTKRELAEAIKAAVSRSRSGRLGAFLIAALVLLFCVFLGSLIIREQVRVVKSQMTAEIEGLRAEVKRLRTLQLNGEAETAISTSLQDSNEAYSPDSPQIQQLLQEWRDEAAGITEEPSNTSTEAGHSDTKHPTTSHSWNDSSVPVTDYPAPTSVQIRRPYDARRDGEWQAVEAPQRLNGPTRKPRRGVTVSPVIKRSNPQSDEQASERDDSDDAVRIERSIAQPVSFAPRRRPTPGVIAIGPDQPRRIVFSSEKAVR